MGTTVVRAVRDKYPDATIDFITEKANIDTLSGNPDINNIIEGESYFEALSVFGTGGYDKFYKLNMTNHIESCWHHIPSLQNQHLVEWYGTKAEVDVTNDKGIYIFPSEKDEKIANELYDSLGKDKVVVFHTSSGQHSFGDVKDQRVESKDWAMMNFNITAERLIKNGYTVVQIGAPSDKVLECEGAINLLGKMTFKQTASFLKRCAGYLGVDSGPAYLSGWSGIPTLLIMGATQNQTPENKGPSVGPRDENVEYLNPVRPNDPKCSPVPCYVHCLIGKAGGCVADITTDMVWDKLKSMLTNEERKNNPLPKEEQMIKHGKD